MDFIPVNIPVVILYYNFSKYYLWRKLGKVSKGPLSIIFHHCVRIYYYLDKILMKIIHGI